MIFGTLVRVIAGFYIGCIGTVTGTDLSAYRVKLQCMSQNQERYELVAVFQPGDLKRISQKEYNKEVNK